MLFRSPKTELSEVLEEFDKMVNGFSGSLMAKSEKGKRVEIRNHFNLRQDFLPLYRSRNEQGFPYNLDSDAKADFGVEGCHGTPDPQQTVGFIHIGSNLEESTRYMMGQVTPSGRGNRQRFSSRLLLVGVPAGLPFPNGLCLLDPWDCFLMQALMHLQLSILVPQCV